MSADFRQYLFPHDHPRLASVRGLDPYAYREAAREPGTFTGGLVEGWTPLYRNEFRGITSDGTLRDGLYPLVPAADDDAAPVAAMVEAAHAFLDLLAPDVRDRATFGVDAVEWQTWANPEFLQFDTGLRLEFQPQAVRDAALELVRASLSVRGYAAVRAAMAINGLLGEVVDLPTILNEYSYNVAIYGTPDLRAPWGWQLFGHHCAVNCLVVEGRMVVSPMFLGAEPNEMDGAPRTLGRHIRQGLQVMEALPPALRETATVYREMVDPAMPPGRVHPGDERHLAGAFQDNRVIPYEGVRVTDMPENAQDAVDVLAQRFLDVLPDGPFGLRLAEVRAHYDETWFSWIGGTDVFYYRLQSPVIIAELDHHCGVFLDYDTPKPFHIHTVLRTPNGNDYGRAWVRQWHES